MVRGDLSAGQAAGARNRLLAMLRLSSPRALFTRAWELATELGRSQGYDAFHLATAELLDVELWTADERINNAAVGRFEKRGRRLRAFSVDNESGGSE